VERLEEALNAAVGDIRMDLREIRAVIGQVRVEAPPAPRTGHPGGTVAELAAEVQRLTAEVRGLHMNHGERSAAAVLSLGDAAAYVGVSRRTLERWIAAKRVRASKLAPGAQGSVRVLRSELDRFLAERTRS